MSMSNIPGAAGGFSGAGSGGSSIAVAVELAKQLGLVDILKQALLGLFLRAPKPIPEPLPVPQPPPTGTVTPIVPPPASTPQPGQTARKVAKVVLRVQKAQAPERVNTGNDLNLYSDPMGIVNRTDPFHVGAVLWLDMTAYDEEGEEWQGHSIVAADLEYRTRHTVRKAGGGTSFIEGRGGNPGEPNAWAQSNDGGVNWGFRAWKDSVGMNARATFVEEGDFEVVASFAGVESNSLSLRVR